MPADDAPEPVGDAMSSTTDHVPRIGRGFRLQWEQAQSAYVLLYPEGMVKLNASAGEILKRCDGTAPVEAIVAGVEQLFGASNLARDVRAFLDLATEQRWVEWT